MAPLLCTVRGCRRPLVLAGSAWRCAAGHAYDVSRSGYVNLVQPQDRRSLRAGDREGVVAARRRLLARGVAGPLIAALAGQLLDRVAPGARLLDVGCGEGTILRELAVLSKLEAHGTDLSVPAVEAAARAFPSAQWVVANADRMVPWADGSLAAALSVNARTPAEELRRVLAPGGTLLVAAPAEDDQVELRSSVLGHASPLGSGAAALGALAAHFELVAQCAVRHRVRLDAGGLRDALASTYRGARRSLRERIEGLEPLEVTFGWELLTLRPRA